MNTRTSIPPGSDCTTSSWNLLFTQACGHNHLEDMHFLTQPEFWPLITSFSLQGAYEWACFQGRLEALSFFLDGTLDSIISSINESIGSEPSLDHLPHETRELLLLTSQWSSNIKNEGLSKACQYGRLDCVQWLLTSPTMKQRSDHLQWSPQGLSGKPLIMACSFGQWEVVRWLALDYGLQDSSSLQAMKQHHPLLRDLLLARQEHESLRQCISHSSSTPPTDPIPSKTNRRRL